MTDEPLPGYLQAWINERRLPVGAAVNTVQVLSVLREQMPFPVCEPFMDTINDGVLIVWNDGVTVFDIEVFSDRPTEFFGWNRKTDASLECEWTCLKDATISPAIIEFLTPFKETT